MRTATILSATAIALVAIGSPVLAQRGTGDEQGIVRSDVAVEPARVAGTVMEVLQTTCEATTGRSPIGVHLIVEAADGDGINLHLGPLVAMDDVLAAVHEGDRIQADAFRTDALAAGHYVARTLTVDEQTFVLRGENLQPVWAGSGRMGQADGSGLRGGQGQGAGQGMGGGRGQGGQGLGLGPCQW